MITGQNPIILEKIIQRFPDQIHLKAERNTALQTLLKESNDSEERTDNILKCAEILLQNGVDVNSKDKNNKTALAVYAEVKDKNKQLFELLKNKANTQLVSTKMTALDFITNRDTDGFIREFQKKQFFEKELIDCLPFVVENNMLDIAECIVDAIKAFPDDQNESHPLLIARDHRHDEMLKLLIENIKIPEDILIQFIRTTNGFINDAKFLKCYEMIIDNDNENVNYAYEGSNTALHYAAKYENWDVIQLLLKNNASLANCNASGQMALVDVHADVLRKHFDHCVQFGYYQHSYEERLRLAFNYTTLFPSKTKNIGKNSKTYEDTKIDMSREKSSQNGSFNAIDVMLHLCNDREKRSLLLHPLINAFVNAMWHKMEIFVFVNFIAYMLYMVALGCYLGIGDGVSRAFLSLMCLVLIGRTCVQFGYKRANYFKQKRNYVEVALCSVLVLVLLTDRMDFKVIAALLSAALYLLMLSTIPIVASYLNMFQKVYMHCCKVSLIFFVLTLAFAYSFHALSRTRNSNKSKYFSSLFNTMVMLIEKYEVRNSLLYAENPTLQIIVILFVYSMSVVLTNLLTALAFGDIQQIKMDAKLHEMITRIKYIAEIEPQCNASEKVAKAYLDKHNMLYISLKNPGKINRNIVEGKSKTASEFCLRCLSWQCQYKLSKRITTTAKNIATENAQR